MTNLSQEARETLFIYNTAWNDALAAVEEKMPEGKANKARVKYEKDGDIKSYEYFNHSQNKGFNSCRS